VVRCITWLTKINFRQQIKNRQQRRHKNLIKAKLDFAAAVFQAAAEFNLASLFHLSANRATITIIDFFKCAITSHISLLFKERF
jgi:hypothetical protein